MSSGLSIQCCEARGHVSSKPENWLSPQINYLIFFIIQALIWLNHHSKTCNDNSTLFYFFLNNLEIILNYE